MLSGCRSSDGHAHPRSAPPRSRLPELGRPRGMSAKDPASTSESGTSPKALPSPFAERYRVAMRSGPLAVPCRALGALGSCRGLGLLVLVGCADASARFQQFEQRRAAFAAVAGTAGTG